MTFWIDAVLLPLIVGLPLVGAAFVAMMPDEDRVAVRHVGMVATISIGLCGLRAVYLMAMRGAALVQELSGPLLSTAYPLELGPHNVVAVMGLAAMTPMALRGGAPRAGERTKGYVLLVLMLEALLLLSMTSRGPLGALVFLNAATYPALLLLSLYGGSLKGSVGIRFATLWLIADALALAGLLVVAHAVIPESESGIGAWLARSAPLAAIAGAAAARFGLFPFTSWLSDLLEESPVSLVSLLIAGVFPAAAVFLVRWGPHLAPSGIAPLWPVFVILAGGTALYAVSQALIERDLRRYLGSALGASLSFAVLALLADEPRVATSALVFLALIGFGGTHFIFVIDAMERRYYTRDSTDLAGFAMQLPGLWRLFLVGGLSLVGVPLIGAGTLLPSMLIRLPDAPVFKAAGLPPSTGLTLIIAFALVFVLLTAAFGAHLRRTLAAPRGKLRPPAPLLVGQSVRLWIPGLFVLGMGFVSPWVVDFIAASVAPARAATLDVDTPATVVDDVVTGALDLEESPSEVLE